MVVNSLDDRPLYSLDGQVALVVGGGQTPGQTIGNGRATALTFARAGASVAVADLNLDSAEQTAQLIRNEGGAASGMTVDVADEQSIARMVQTCLAQFGAVTILHNNVGISYGVGDAPVTDISGATFRHILDVNLVGATLTCKHALGAMRAAGGGAIVNVSSIAAISDYPNVAYKTSKAALNALTQHLAIRNAEYGIRVNAIMPGLIDTPTALDARTTELATTREAIAENRRQRVPLLAQMGSAWDIAAAALFLASPQSRFITGVILPVDGGQLLKIGY